MGTFLINIDILNLYQSCFYSVNTSNSQLNKNIQSVQNTYLMKQLCTKMLDIDIYKTRTKVVHKNVSQGCN